MGVERRANIIKHLKMMGYIVSENEDGSADVMLKTNNGYYYRIVLYLDDFYKDFIIEETVCLINSCIMKDF